jgi:hypothetical protein
MPSRASVGCKPAPCNTTIIRLGAAGPCALALEVIVSKPKRSIGGSPVVLCTRLSVRSPTASVSVKSRRSLLSRSHTWRARRDPDGARRLQSERGQRVCRGTAPALFIGDPAAASSHVDAGAVDQVEGLVRSKEPIASRTYLGRGPLAVCEMPSPFDIPPGEQFCLDAGIAPIKLSMRGALLIQVAPACRVQPGSIGIRGRFGSGLIAGTLQTARELLI